MPNIASVLKAEIARVARKEIKAEAGSLKTASARYRSEIAALKRQVAVLQKQVKAISKSGARARPAAEEDSSSKPRFSAKGLTSQRKRLGLSAEAVGKLVGASALSIYKWESGKVRPRDSYLPALAALRKLGRKQAAEILAKR